jgi:hypothetical protein
MKTFWFSHRSREQPHARVVQAMRATRRAPQAPPIRLLPPEFVVLDADHERQAVEVLADLFADCLGHEVDRGDTSWP